MKNLNDTHAEHKWAHVFRVAIFCSIHWHPPATDQRKDSKNSNSPRTSSRGRACGARLKLLHVLLCSLACLFAAAIPLVTEGFRLIFAMWDVEEHKTRACNRILQTHRLLAPRCFHRAGGKFLCWPLKFWWRNWRARTWIPCQRCSADFWLLNWGT